jgi:hypothetical protein
MITLFEVQHLMKSGAIGTALFSGGNDIKWTLETKINFDPSSLTALRPQDVIWDFSVEKELSKTFSFGVGHASVHAIDRVDPTKQSYDYLKVKWLKEW